MKSSRVSALVALGLGGWFLMACGSSTDDAVAPPYVAPPSPSAPATVPSAPAPAAAAPDPVQTPPAPANQPSSEQVDDNLPIAAAPAPAPAGGGSAMAGETAAGDGEPAGEGGDQGAAGAPAETPPAPTQSGDLKPITIWIAGDSTVANGETPCPRGWGGVFKPHFNDLVTVNNAAVGGRSVNTWLYNVQTVMDATGECVLTRDANGEPTLQPRWQTMLDGMKAGDYLFIQFGINDGDRTCDRHVGIDAFKESYGMMAAAAKERGAQPIFLTPISSISCTGNTARNSRGAFVPATIDAGAAFDVPVIDLNALSVELFQERGFCPIPGGDVSAATTGPVGDFFCDDHTHFSPAGAVEVGNVVAKALADQKIPLAAYLR